jgi:hypothetical protein
MFDLWGGQKHSPTVQRRARLNVEPLEDRLVLSAPQLIYSMSVIEGRTVSISGTVLDERPETTTVTFSGVLDYSIVPGPDGQFSFVIEATSPGFVVGRALDDEMLMSPEVVQYLDIEYFDIVDVSLSFNDDEDGEEYLVTGRLVGTDVSGVSVVLSDGYSSWVTTTDSFGNFRFAANLSLANNFLNIKPILPHNFPFPGGGNNPGRNFPVPGNLPPAILRLRARDLGGGTWVIFGKVRDEFPHQVTVRFNGIPAVQGRTAQCDLDGTFSIVVQLAPNEGGLVQAIARDNLNQDSLPKYTLLGF